MTEEKINLPTNTSRIKETLINFIVPLICLAVAVLLIIFVIYPGIVNIPKFKQELNDRNQKKEVLAEKSTNLKKLIFYKAMLEQNSALVDRALSSTDNIPQLLDEVYQMSVSSGVKVNRLNYSYSDAGALAPATDSAPSKALPIKQVEVSLGTEGSYDQIVFLLQEIENAARVINATSFRYTSDEKGVLLASYVLDSPYLFVQANAVTDESVNLDVTNQKFIDFINKIKTLQYYEFKNQQIQVIEETKQSTPTGGGQN